MLRVSGMGTGCNSKSIGPVRNSRIQLCSFENIRAIRVRGFGEDLWAKESC